MKHIPNIITSCRIVLIGVFVWMFSRALKQDFSFWIPILVYAIAFLSDILDGFLARNFHWVTPVGKILDPIADKLMAFAALICILIGKNALNDHPVLYTVLFLLIAAKDALMIIGGLFMLRAHKVAYADWYGKTATGVLTLGVVLTLLGFAEPVIQPWDIGVLSAAVALSYVAMIHYARTQLFVKKEDSDESEDEQKLFDSVDRITNNLNEKEKGLEQLLK